MESFEQVGIWWLPNDPENTLQGTLTFDPQKGAWLDLIGHSFGHKRLQSEGNNSRIEMIHGVIKGARITLRDCIVIKVRHSFPGFEERRLFIGCIFKGNNFKSIEDIAFKQLRVNYSYLSDWMNQNNFRLENNHELSYKPFESIKIPLSDKSIEFGYEFSSSETINRYIFQNSPFVSVMAHSDDHFDHYLELINFHIPNFLTLATGQIVHQLKIIGITSKSPVPIEIFYSVDQYTHKPQTITSWHMLFTFADISENLPKYIANWINKSDKLVSVYDLYFKLYNNRSMDIKTRFLLLAQALETYHRELYGGAYLSEEEYEPIKSILIDAIPDWVDKSHRDKLKGMIGYGYEYSLRKRLKTICNDILKDHKETIIGLFVSVNEFANKVKDTRNDLTHHPQNPSKYALSITDMWDYVHKMQLLLQICFLVELGLSSHKIHELIRSSQSFQHWLVETHETKDD